MAGRSDKERRGGARKGRCGLGTLLLTVALAGCQAGSERIWPETPRQERTMRGTFLEVYSPVPQVVTADGWEKMLARYHGQVLVVCVWRASDPNAVASLHEAPEIQTRYRSSRILSLNLDAPDEWLSAVVPVLRQAQVRFPVVTCTRVHRTEILKQLGMTGLPGALTYVVLSPAGKIMAIHRPFEPPKAVAVALPPMEEKPRPAASQSVAVAMAADALRYSLRIVRVADDAAVGHVTGIGWAKDLVRAREPGDDEARVEMASWLRMLGIEVASRLKSGERVAIAPIRCGSGLTEATGKKFSLTVAAAVRAAGRGVKDPAEVEGACGSLGIAAELLEIRPSTLRASLGAEYILVGTVVADKSENLP